MEVVIVPNRAVGAALVADSITTLVARRPHAVLGLATGSTPEAVYDELVRRVRGGGTDSQQCQPLRLDGIRAFLLDEYVGLPAEHPASYRAVIRRQFVDRLGLRPAQVEGPDAGAADLSAACNRYEAAIQQAGGIDLQLLGIGGDGHVGFNEPSSSLGSRTRIKTLTSQTVHDNSRFFTGAHQVPNHVITQGLANISQARHLVLMAWGSSKAWAIAKCVEGPVTAMVPASVLQLHPHVTVVIDDDAASRLQLADYYRSTYRDKPPWQGL
ncbi:MAG: glucosamine-6-phosphate deaminase [Actinomycetota bacterium]|nr:glucosamine-6-phosphate deaminase [Actinomycetota bacterium]